MNISDFKQATVSESSHFFDRVGELINTEGYRWIVHIDWSAHRGLSYFFIHPEKAEPFILNVVANACQLTWPSMRGLFRALTHVEEKIYAKGGPQFQTENWIPRYQWGNRNDLPDLGSRLTGAGMNRESLHPSEGNWVHTIGLNDVFAGQFTFHLKGSEKSNSRVESCQFERGLYRTSWCDRASELDWRQLLNLTNSISPGSPYFANLALVESLEDHLGIAVTERAGAIRMILCELSRVFDHIQSLHTLWIVQGAGHWEETFVDLGVQVYELLGKYARGEWTGNLNTLGGVRYDLPEDWKNQLLVFISRLMKVLDGAQLTIERSPGLISTLTDIHMGLKEVMDHTLTGPVARACGLRRDLRKLSGRYFYHEVDFEIPLGINSTFYDVVLVKLEEMRQSLSIMAQILDGIPFDTIQNPEYSLFWNVPDYETLSVEEREEVIEKLRSGPGPVVSRGFGSVEGPRGELSVVWEDRDGRGPAQISIISPSRQLSYFIEKHAKGQSVSSVYSMCALTHLSPEEMDI